MNGVDQMAAEKLGVALSGGGIRGLAHIGVMKVLLNRGVVPDLITGTSMGSIIAACIAVGVDIDEIEEFALRISRSRNLMRLVHLAPPNRGLLDAGKVHDALAEIIPPDMEFSDLKIPLAVSATDLIRSQSVSISSGNVLDAVMASISVPGLFPPVDMPPYRFVDGGVLNNIPVDLAYRLGASKTIAVDVLLHPERDFSDLDGDGKPDWPIPVPGFYLDIMSSVMMMAARITSQNLQIYKPDLVIQPLISRGIDIFMGFNRAAEVIANGVDAAEQVEDEVLSLCCVPA